MRREAFTRQDHILGGTRAHNTHPWTLIEALYLFGMLGLIFAADAPLGRAFGLSAEPARYWVDLALLVALPWVLAYTLRVRAHTLRSRRARKDFLLANEGATLVSARHEPDKVYRVREEADDELEVSLVWAFGALIDGVGAIREPKDAFVSFNADAFMERA